jgi:hypothetical protein
MKVIESWSGCGSSCKCNGQRTISKMCGLDRIMRSIYLKIFIYHPNSVWQETRVDNNVRPKPSDWTLLARLTVRWQSNSAAIEFDNRCIMLRDSPGRRALRKAFNDFQRSCLAISPKIHVQFLNWRFWRVDMRTMLPMFFVFCFFMWRLPVWPLASWRALLKI